MRLNPRAPAGWLQNRFRRACSRWFQSPYNGLMPSYLRNRTLLEEPGYAIFRMYNNRYERLPIRIAGILQPAVEVISRFRRVRVLDLGCGMLWTTTPLLQELSKRTTASFDVRLCDPDPDVARYVGRVINRSLPWRGTCAFQQAGALPCIRDVADQSFDIILCVNMLFYLPPKHRSELLVTIAQTLSEQGRLVSVIRDRDAPFWQTFDPILEPLQAEMLGGVSLFADDVLQELQTHAFETEVTTNHFQFSVPFGNDLLRIVEFLYRLPKGRLINDPDWRRRIREAVLAGGGRNRVPSFAMKDRIMVSRVSTRAGRKAKDGIKNSRRWASLADCLRHHATVRPDAPALMAPGRDSLDYGGLWQHAQSIGATLCDAGIACNDRVAIVLPNGPDLASAFLCIGASAVTAPLNPAYPVDEMSFYLSDLRAKALIIEAGSRGPARTAAERLGLCILELDSSVADPAGLFRLRALDSSRENKQPKPVHRYCVGDDTALLLHTSGTTSRPKLVPLAHRNMSASGVNIMSSLALTPDDRCLNVMPLFHIHGLIGATLSSITAGASIVCCPPFDGDAFFDWAEEHRPTWYSAVPTIHQTILARSDAYPSVISAMSLRFIRSSSAALPPSVMLGLEERFGCPVVESYGMTEACHQMTSNPLPPAARKPGTVGPAAGPEVAIMDEEGRLLMAGETGEIVIRGENVMNGYENNPQANADAFTNGWFRTGDQGHLDNDGYVTISGRLKEIINRGGEKISPREIDEVLLQHPAVQQAVTFATPHPSLGEEVAMVVIRERGAEVSEQALREHAAERLAPFKVPRQIVFVETIPKGPTGKLQRIGLADKLSHLLQAPFTAPQGEIEEKLVAIWSELLQVQSLGTRDNVFTRGADSLLATRAVARVNFEFQIQMPLEWLAEAPTVRQLASRVMQCGATGDTGTNIKRLTDRNEAPLSFGQERLWLLDNLELTLIGHNRPTIMRLRGNLDIGVLRRALTAIVDRHTALRTSIRELNGQLVQRIEAVRDVELPVIDFRDLPIEHRERSSVEHAVEQSRSSFDLTSGDLLRSVLIRLQDLEFMLILNSHHIAFDGWSQSVLYRELAEFYDAFAAGRAPQLKELPIQYVDFSAWQRQTMLPSDFEEGLTYWERTIGRNPAYLELPLDRPRPVSQSFAGARRFFEVPPALRDRLVALSEDQGVTLFTVLICTYATLLHRFSGHPKVIIGTPFAGRDQYETEGLIGLFINTVPILCDFSEDHTFTTLLKRQRGILTEAQKYRHVPFQSIVQRLLHSRDLSRSPLFQALIIYENFPASPRAFGEVEVEPVEIDFGKALLDISLELMDTLDGLHGHLEYATDFLEPATAETMTQSYLALLEEVSRNPNRPVSALPLTSKDPRTHRASTYAPVTPAIKPKLNCVHQYIETFARDTPDSIALCCEDERLSYGGLDLQARRVAHALRSHGVKPGDVIGIGVERGCAMFVGVLAVLKAGGAYLPLDLDYPDERLEYMLTDSAATCVLTQNSLANRSCFRSVPILNLDQLPENSSPATDDIPTRAEDPAYVIYTSGSTGNPKGVLVSHANLISACDAWNEAYGLKKVVRSHLQTMSFSFDVSAGDWARALGSGGRLVIAKQDQILEPAALLDLMKREQIDFSEMSKVVIQQLFRYLRQTGQRVDFVKQFVVGGEPWSPHEFAEIANQLGPSTRIWNSYGVTEATIDNSLFTDNLDGRPWTAALSIGRPLRNSRFYVVDSALNPVPDGVCGELLIGGECVAIGYINNPDLTRQHFISLALHEGATERVYRTGDVVRRRRDGNFDFVGRVDRQLKIRGLRIEPGEIEVKLRSHDAIREAVVTDRVAAEGSRDLAAYVVCDADQKLAPRDIRGWLRERVPAHMVPTTVTMLDIIPRLPSGKCNYEALPEPEPDVSLPPSIDTLPETDAEIRVSAIWSEILGIDGIYKHDSFFLLGGHSVLAMQVVNRVNDAFGTGVRLRLLFEHPRLCDFSRAIEDSTDKTVVRDSGTS